MCFRSLKRKKWMELDLWGKKTYATEEEEKREKRERKREHFEPIGKIDMKFNASLEIG
jgi:hypothetical protein